VNGIWRGTFLLACLLGGMAHAGEPIRLYRYAFDPQQGGPPIPQRLRLTEDADQPYWLLQLTEPMRADFQRALAQRGVETLNYIPENAFVVRLNGPPPTDLPFIAWLGPYHPAYKLHPEIGRANFSVGAARQSLGFVLHATLHPRSPMRAVRTALRRMGGEILAEVDAWTLQRFEVRFPTYNPALVEALAQLTDVAWISEKGERGARNDRARWILQSYDDPSNVTMATPVYDNGLRGEGEIVGLIDGAIDLDHCSFADSMVGAPGPDHRKIVYYGGAAGADPHGTHVAGSLAGVNENGDLAGAGMAYEARIAFTEWFGNQSGQLFNTLATHGQQGAFVHSNSWGEVDGSPVATDYTVDCVDIDTFAYHNEDHLVAFAAMNDLIFPLGPLLSPENAINVLAVGATEMGLVAEPQTLAERHGSSRRGPVPLDGRRKPEIFAPGVSLASARFDTACAVFAQSGTSMATPLVAGAAALVRQYFRDGYYPDGAAEPARGFSPSGALLKAVLLNGTVNMREESENQPGVFSDAPIPNNVEGWGRLNLDRSLHFPGDPQKLAVRDVRNAQGLSTGESQVWQITVADGSQPLRATMAFTAPPGALAALFPVVNDLDLKVVAPDGTQYWGNNWSDGASIPGELTDPLNNVEQILLPEPEPGVYRFEVFARGVNIGKQGFAWAATGGFQCACDDLAPDAGPDAALACWGDAVTLGGLGVCALEGAVSWSPAEGLSDPASPFPTAAPTQTTTYTMTVDLGGGCLRSDQTTVFVPDMDVDDDGALSFSDLNGALPEWGAASPRDYNGNGLVDMADLVRLAACVGSASP